MYKKFKQIIYRKLIPFIRIWKKLNWHIYLNTHEEINLIIGAGPTKYKGWFPTDIITLDVTNEDHFKKYFKKKKINKILAEHVLEHLTNDGLEVMIKNFFKYSDQNVNIRIAVPDGFHKDINYINIVKPGGIGEGADDHKNLFNYRSLSALFEKYGFKVSLIDYWDEEGEFHHNYSNDENGTILRSFLNDRRNEAGKANYTSLIIDFYK